MCKKKKKNPFGLEKPEQPKTFQIIGLAASLRMSACVSHVSSIKEGNSVCWREFLCPVGGNKKDRWQYRPCIQCQQDVYRQHRVGEGATKAVWTFQTKGGLFSVQTRGPPCCCLPPMNRNTQSSLAKSSFRINICFSAQTFISI